MTWTECLLVAVGFAACGVLLYRLHERVENLDLACARLIVEAQEPRQTYFVCDSRMFKVGRDC